MKPIDISEVKNIWNGLEWRFFRGLKKKVKNFKRNFKRRGVMYKIRKELKRFLKEEKAQGATEYILILVAIVALVMLFKNGLRK